MHILWRENRGWGSNNYGKTIIDYGKTIKT
jgi:hypothetical protein